MIAPLLAAFTVLMPLNPGDDQATLRALVAEGGVTLVEIKREHWGPDTIRSGKVASWNSTTCRSSGMLLTEGHPARFDIEWGSDQMRITLEDRTVTVRASGRMGIDPTFAFTFPDSGKAGEAALAFRRIRGGCTAQR